ncbi:cation:proton antiporter [Candidatus Woesearchaeota archaeon]|nr:cation:proton antiporter [Nanoarchaeota archaeon]MCB9370212.1 cation:proton antiporter [Candidatus Woesearchaeota archaeon]USN44740.1 MAG: cation:proton antiporter [Candidatus Woesearchaeota archaeon]
MENIYLIYAGIFLLTLLLGKFFEKFRIPWIFSGIFVGTLFSFSTFSNSLGSNPSFVFLANLGMYFLLFIIGFEINLKNISKQNKPILKTTTYVILFETILGSIVLYFLFDLHWLMALIVASSFATVGEAVLLPILDEFGLTRKAIGQRILSIGILDDLFEIFVIVIVSIVVGGTKNAHFNIFNSIAILAFLFLLVYVLFKAHKDIQNFKYRDVNSLLLFVLFFVFLFIGIGEFIDSSSLGALLAGISLRNLVPHSKLFFIEKEIKALSYGFLAPIFFVWVGLSVDFYAILSNAWLVLLIVIVTVFAKVFGSYLSSKKELGVKKSIFMGLALTVKLSTGIVVLSVLHDNSLITTELFSVLIGTSIIFTLLVPLLLPLFIKNWFKDDLAS